MILFIVLFDKFMIFQIHGEKAINVFSGQIGLDCLYFWFPVGFPMCEFKGTIKIKWLEPEIVCGGDK